jgi:hypothetical protein
LVEPKREGAGWPLSICSTAHIATLKKLSWSQSGPITNEAIAVRSAIGYFVFVPPGINERWIEGAGFSLIRKDDVTDNVAQVSRRWHESRERHRAELLSIENEERVEGLQAFFKTVDRLTSERRLSRFVYGAEK